MRCTVGFVFWHTHCKCCTVGWSSLDSYSLLGCMYTQSNHIRRSMMGTYVCICTEYGVCAAQSLCITATAQLYTVISAVLRRCGVLYTCAIPHMQKRRFMSLVAAFFAVLSHLSSWSSPSSLLSDALVASCSCSSLLLRCWLLQLSPSSLLIYTVDTHMQHNIAD